MPDVTIGKHIGGNEDLQKLLADEDEWRREIGGVNRLNKRLRTFNRLSQDNATGQLVITLCRAPIQFIDKFLLTLIMIREFCCIAISSLLSLCYDCSA